jgi:hypothetical protein
MPAPEQPIRAVISADGSRLVFATGERQRLASMAGQPVEIRRQKKDRSLDQNAWCWGVAYPLIAESLGYEPHEIEELHYGLVAKWGGEHFDKRLGAMVPNKRSSKLTTKEFSDYMEWLVRFGAKECGGVNVPLPGEMAA